MTPGTHWGDDSPVEPPSARTSNILAWLLGGFVVLVVVLLWFLGRQA